MRARRRLPPGRRRHLRPPEPHRRPRASSPASPSGSAPPRRPSRRWPSSPRSSWSPTPRSSRSRSARARSACGGPSAPRAGRSCARCCSSPPWWRWWAAAPACSRCSALASAVRAAAAVPLALTPATALVELRLGGARRRPRRALPRPPGLAHRHHRRGEGGVSPLRRARRTLRDWLDLAARDGAPHPRLGGRAPAALDPRRARDRHRHRHRGAGGLGPRQRAQLGGAALPGARHRERVRLPPQRRPLRARPPRRRRAACR